MKIFAICLKNRTETCETVIISEEHGGSANGIVDREKELKC